MIEDWEPRANELAAEAIAAGEPTAWFDRLYAEGAAGDLAMPWGRDQPMPLLLSWLDETRPEPGRAVVVGCGLGADAEHLAGLGHTVTAFDQAPTAVAQARARHPQSSVDYRVADATDLPADLVGGFDLVVEIFTLQSVPDPPRSAIAAGVASLPAPGGTLLVVTLRDTGVDEQGPPFQLTLADLARLEVDGVRRVRLEEADRLWVATFRRD